MDFIPIYRPLVGVEEEALVLDAVRSSWISSKGKYIDEFEKGFAEFVGVPEACSVSNGTVAVHLCLAALGIEAGDEVILPAFTYVASLNPIVQVGAIPVFVDSLVDDVHFDPAAVEAAITDRTKAVMAVHLYGGACDIVALRDICDRHSLLLIEDAAEGFGTFVGDYHVGTFGDAASFSFYGNKTITTGEGGMVLARDPRIMKKMRHLKNQGVSAVREYWHDALAYNYRMTNLAAAIGVAQLGKAKDILKMKTAIAEKYHSGAEGTGIQFLMSRKNVTSSYWLITGFAETLQERDSIRVHLSERGIETRPAFPVVCDFPHIAVNADCPNARRFSETGINFPSFPTLSESDVGRILDALRGRRRSLA